MVGNGKEPNKNDTKAISENTFALFEVSHKNQGKITFSFNLISTQNYCFLKYCKDNCLPNSFTTAHACLEHDRISSNCPSYTK